MRFILAFFLFMGLASAQEMNFVEDPDQIAAIIYNTARHYHNTIGESEQYVVSITTEAKRYGLNPIMMMRQGALESWLTRGAVAHVPGEGAYGWAQIIPKNWGWVLPYVITNYDPRNYYLYFFDIDASAKMLGYIMSYLRKDARGDYPLALVAYNYGPYSWWYWTYYRNNYNQLKNWKYWKMVYIDWFFLQETGMTREKIFDKTKWHEEIVYRRIKTFEQERFQPQSRP